MELQKRLSDFQSSALSSLESVSDLKRLEEWRVTTLGKKSELSTILKSLGELSDELKRELGEAANNTKNTLMTAYETALASFKTKVAVEEALDITLPGTAPQLGKTHVISSIIQECCEIFRDMGFVVAEGNEVETPYYSFDALNIPPDHPARDTMDTFWLEGKVKGSREFLLRPHTSPMQVRYMETHKPPIRIVVPGKVYRYEATDATHLSMFHQIEGLAIGKGVSMADLKGVLTTLIKRLFGEDRKLRFRVDYFPFVEPGAEIAINCIACAGAGCSLCKGTGWIEILGAGMVHPKVLKSGKIEGDYTGFAFGIGIERIAMLRYGVEDIRNFYHNDLRFLRQF